MSLGTISIGLHCPIIKEGDSIKKIVLSTLKENIDNNLFNLSDKDVICITESIVARAQQNYCTIDEMLLSMKNLFKENKKLALYSPIMSRNRFSLILRAFARYADEIIILVNGEHDEQGNPTYGINQFTGVDIQQYYTEICNEENCKVYFKPDYTISELYNKDYIIIDARCHPNKNEFNTTKYKLKNHIEDAEKVIVEQFNKGVHKQNVKFDLTDIMKKPVKTIINDNAFHDDLLGDGLTYEKKSGFNSDYGVLGSNKATENTLKLFPRDCNKLCKDIQKDIKKIYNKDVEVLVYGDGCFKDPVGGIWEFADPVTCPGYTEGLNGTPNELKMKYLADNKFANLRGNELKEALKQEIAAKDKDLVGKMASEGTTPRRYIDLLASLADLTSGSGDKGTPIILIKNYFNNYAS